MTILEANIYTTLDFIEAEKALANIEPSNTLLIKDKLLERATERIGHSISSDELHTTLLALQAQGRIHMGNTLNDKYIKIIYREIESSL